MCPKAILGLLLFIVFINDIVNEIRSSVRLLTYDTCAFEVSDGPIASAAALNEVLRKVLAWAKTWLVLFNALKTEVMNITKKKRIRVYHPPLFMGDTQVKEVSQHKHLGLIISSVCSWNNHVKMLQDKAFK